jgi:hypothetical protein
MIFVSSSSRNGTPYCWVKQFTDKLLARKSDIVETVIDQLKNISQIERSRHRSPTNFMVNVLCGLIA